MTLFRLCSQIFAGAEATTLVNMMLHQLASMEHHRIVSNRVQLPIQKQQLRDLIEILIKPALALIEKRHSPVRISSSEVLHSTFQSPTKRLSSKML